MKRIALGVVLFVLLAAPALAGLEEGWAAYERGDYASGLREWKPLAEQGTASAQYYIGFMYANGQGVRRDDGEAAKWYRLAAYQGHAGAQLLLGLLYRKGRGVPADYVQAHMWYSLAAAGTPSSEMRSRLIRLRDILAESMTVEQIAKAERLAQEWKAKRE